MNVNSGFLKVLAQIGFAACFRGFPKEAISIFEGMRAARSENEHVKTGLGIAYMNAYRLDEAIALLNEALAADPDNVTAKSFLGLTLKLAGRKAEGTRHLQQISEDANASQDSKIFVRAVMQNADLDRPSA